MRAILHECYQVERCTNRVSTTDMEMFVEQCENIYSSTLFINRLYIEFMGLFSARLSGLLVTLQQQGMIWKAIKTYVIY